MNRNHYPEMTDLEWALTTQGYCRYWHGKNFASPTGFHWVPWKPGRVTDRFSSKEPRYVVGRGGNIFPAEAVEQFPATYDRKYW